MGNLRQNINVVIENWKFNHFSDDPDATDDYLMPTEEEIVAEPPDPKEFCSCTNCPKMPTLEESVCCKTLKKFKNKDGTGKQDRDWTYFMPN